MRCKDITFSSPEENLLLDDALLLLAERGHSGGEILRFWESSSFFVVLGRTGKADEDVVPEQSQRDDIPVLRRSSGGGTVLQGPGCFNYTLILDKQADERLHDIRKSYQVILTEIIRIMSRNGVQAEFRPVSDLVVPEGERKFSGNAQKRAKRFILHHGTILYDFDIDKIEQCLRIPHAVPEYRRGRAHQEFLVNIPLNQQQIKNAFLQHFHVQTVETALTPEEAECLSRLQNSV